MAAAAAVNLLFFLDQITGRACGKTQNAHLSSTQSQSGTDVCKRAFCVQALHSCVFSAFAGLGVFRRQPLCDRLQPVLGDARARRGPSLHPCHVPFGWTPVCVTPPTPTHPQRTMGTDCTYHIQECSSNRAEARSHRQPPPVLVHPAESLFFFHLSSPLFSLSFPDHGACLIVLYTEQACRTDV